MLQFSRTGKSGGSFRDVSIGRSSVQGLSETKDKSEKLQKLKFDAKTDPRLELETTVGCGRCSEVLLPLRCRTRRWLQASDDFLLSFGS